MLPYIDIILSPTIPILLTDFDEVYPQGIFFCNNVDNTRIYFSSQLNLCLVLLTTMTILPPILIIIIIVIPNMFLSLLSLVSIDDNKYCDSNELNFDTAVNNVKPLLDLVTPVFDFP